jgi:hypothetical protein
MIKRRGDAPVERAGDQAAQAVPAIDQLHHQQVLLLALLIGEAPEVVHRDHVLALHLGDALRLALEARHGSGVGEQVVGDALDRHGAAQRQLHGAIDFAHSAAAEQLIDAHAADLTAGTEHGAQGTWPICAPNGIGTGTAGEEVSRCCVAAWSSSHARPCPVCRTSPQRCAPCRFQGERSQCRARVAA